MMVLEALVSSSKVSCSCRATTPSSPVVGWEKHSNRSKDEGKKNKRRGTKESDWKEYWGSSDRLQADVTQLGEDKFTREILHYCPSRGIASYLEAREQFERRVLETDDYYNGIINVRVGGSKILKEHLKTL